MHATVDTLFGVIEQLYLISSKVIDFIMKPLGSGLDSSNLWESSLIVVLKNHGLYGMSLLQIMLGAGLLFFVGYTVYKWFLGGIPLA